MEFIMAYYNYFFHTSAFLDEAFWLACVEFIPAFITGVICEWFIVSRIAKRVAKCLCKKKVLERNIIHVNEFIIALGMMCVISLFGMLYHSDEISPFFIRDFLVDFVKNGIVGIPLFLLVVSPLARAITYRITCHKDRKDLLL